MDLGAVATRLVGVAAGDAARSWLADLAPVARGETVARYIQDENNLHDHAEGRDAIRRFAERLVLRDRLGDPVAWYEGTLRDSDSDVTVHGPEADPALPGGLCRLVDAWTVRNFLGRDDRLGDPADLDRWLRAVCSPSYEDLLDPTKLVSATTPAVFSTFQVDRDAMFPAGTRASTCLQIVGKKPPPSPTPHALLKYERHRIAPPRVPTAFDASTHPDFVPPPAGAPCGTTRNLTPAGGPGVREVVVRPFPVSQLDQPDYVGP